MFNEFLFEHLQFYLVAMGRGDEYDSRTKARTGVSASFSLNGMNAAGCSASGSTPGSHGATPGVAAAAAAAASENLENSGNMPEPDDQPVDLYRENEELKVIHLFYFFFIFSFSRSKCHFSSGLIK